MTSLTTFDVETVPSTDKEDAALIPPLAKIVSCAFYNPSGRGKVVVRADSFALARRNEEFEILFRETGSFEQTLWAQFDSIRTHHILSFNGRSYDIPVIAHCFASSGIAIPSIVKQAFQQKRWEHTPHKDLREILCGSGLYNKGTLDDYCIAYGITSPKSLCDGSKVAELYEHGKYAEIAEYNYADTRATYELYQAWRKAWE